MIYVSLNNISKNLYGNKILDGINLEFSDTDKVGIVGDNGVGKSTLLNIISKELKPDIGVVSIKKDKKLKYLFQLPMYDNLKVRDILYNNYKNILDIEVKLRQIEMDGDLADNKVLNKYLKLQDEFIILGGYEITSKVEKVVQEFNISKLMDMEYSNLSGGEKRSVALASIFIDKPDIVLLDEPTNHLDIDTLELLEKYLINYKGCMIIVSHDRYFLDKIVNKIVLIENKKCIEFNGNYSDYIMLNEKRIEQNNNLYFNQQKQIKRMEKSAKKLREWGKIGDNEAFFKRAKAIENRIDKIDKIDKICDKKIIPLKFNSEDRTSNNVISINNFNLAIGNTCLLNNINLNIKYMDRVCLMGVNGCGKSTLVKEIINMNPDIKYGTNINIGYIPQEIVFKDNISILEYAKKNYVGEESHLRAKLDKFKFSGEDVFKNINSLSGGEKVRLKMFEIMCNNVNFLILDEPTNHIDINTREVLENAIKSYNGTLLFISHDRYFINNISNKILYIENKSITEYLGNYDYYRSKKNNMI